MSSSCDTSNVLVCPRPSTPVSCKDHSIPLQPAHPPGQELGQAECGQRDGGVKDKVSQLRLKAQGFFMIWTQPLYLTLRRKTGNQNTGQTMSWGQVHLLTLYCLGLEAGEMGKWGKGISYSAQKPFLLGFFSQFLSPQGPDHCQGHLSQTLQRQPSTPLLSILCLGNPFTSVS